MNTISMQDNTANPGPLGLVGFGLPTILLNLHNAGLFAMDTMILSMGLFMGGLLQIIVGMFEWRKNNMFGMIAFTSYGFFWLSLVFLMFFPKMGLAEAPSGISMGYYLVVWGVFTFGMFIGTFKMIRSMSLLFGLALILFGLLAYSDFTGNASVKSFAGVEGVFCGGLALYIGLAELINAQLGKEVLPLK